MHSTSHHSATLYHSIQISIPKIYYIHHHSLWCILFLKFIYNLFSISYKNILHRFPYHLARHVNLPELMAKLAVADERCFGQWQSWCWGNDVLGWWWKTKRCCGQFNVKKQKRCERCAICCVGFWSSSCIWAKFQLTWDFLSIIHAFFLICFFLPFISWLIYAEGSYSLNTCPAFKDDSLWNWPLWNCCFRNSAVVPLSIMWMKYIGM